MKIFGANAAYIHSSRTASQVEAVPEVVECIVVEAATEVQPPVEERVSEEPTSWKTKRDKKKLPYGLKELPPDEVDQNALKS